MKRVKNLPQTPQILAYIASIGTLVIWHRACLLSYLQPLLPHLRHLHCAWNLE